MPETLEQLGFTPTHTIGGVPVMRNPAWNRGVGVQRMYIDEQGEYRTMGTGRKAVPLEPFNLPAATKVAQDGEFGKAYGKVGEVVPTGWWVSHYAHNHAPSGVMVTREAAAAALRACAWPDSAAPCGQAGNSNDDDASFQSYDSEGNCIVRLFMRGRGYFRVRIPREMFLEIVDE